MDALGVELGRGLPLEDRVTRGETVRVCEALPELLAEGEEVKEEDTKVEELPRGERVEDCNPLPDALGCTMETKEVALGETLAEAHPETEKVPLPDALGCKMEAREVALGETLAEAHPETEKVPLPDALGCKMEAREVVLGETLAEAHPLAETEGEPLDVKLSGGKGISDMRPDGVGELGESDPLEEPLPRLCGEGEETAWVVLGEMDALPLPDTETEAESGCAGAPEKNRVRDRRRRIIC